MKLLCLLSVLFLHAAAETYSGAIGTGYYIPDYDLLGEDMYAGYPVFNDLQDSCIAKTNFPEIDSIQAYYANTESFYTSLSTDTSISADLKSDFTLGVTLDISTQSISGGKRTISGLTYQSFSSTSEETLKHYCMDEELDDKLARAFQSLPTVYDPELASSWGYYKNFLRLYGSHVITDVVFGCSLYQHVFAESSKEYNKREFGVKACVAIAGPTEAGELNVSVCQGVTKEDIKASSSMEVSTRFIVRGGSEETRAELHYGRSNELITKFLKEAKETHQPIHYKYTPIWVILQMKYMNTDHYHKAMSLEAFYKGYLNYGCQLDQKNGVVLQKFNFAPNSQPLFPIFQCSLAPDGCQNENDCHYRDAFWCECRGDSCIRYDYKKLNTGMTKKYAHVYQGSGWGWQGCELSGFSCYCTDQNYNWDVVWELDQDKMMLTKLLNKDALQRGSQGAGEKKYEL